MLANKLNAARSRAVRSCSAPSSAASRPTLPGAAHLLGRRFADPFGRQLGHACLARHGLLFRVLGRSLPETSAARAVIEGQFFGKEIHNIVVGEGAEGRRGVATGPTKSPAG